MDTTIILDKQGVYEFKKKSPYWIGIVLFFIALIATFGAYIYYNYALSTEVGRVQEFFKRSLSNKTERILLYLKKHIESSENIAKEVEMQEAFSKLATPESSQEYKKALASFLDEHATEEGYKNTLLINKDGRVLFCDFSEKYVGLNLREKPQDYSALGRSYMRVMMGLSLDIAEFKYDDILKRPALFVSVPVFKGSELMGVLVQEVMVERIYTIMADYVGLGSTGDVIYGIDVKDGIILINKSRIEATQPFKRFIFYSKLIDRQNFPLANAISGQQGAGVVTNFEGTKDIAAWAYVPVVEWGGAITMDYTQVEGEFSYIISIGNILMALTCLFALLCCMTVPSLKHYIVATRHKLVNPVIFRHVLVVIAAIFLILGLIYLYEFSLLDKRQLNDLKDQTVERVTNALWSLNHTLYNAESTGLSLAYDLSHEYLSREDLLTRMGRELKEHPSIQGITVAFEPYAYAADKKLYAPYMKRKGRTNEIKTMYHDQMYDYTVPDAYFPGATSWIWYSLALKHGKIWFDPYIEPETGILMGGYSVPFYSATDKTKVIGIVNVMIDLSNIENIIADLEFGKSGYAYLLSAQGVFLYHPIAKYVTSRNTMVDRAHAEGNAELLAIAQNIFDNNKEGFSSYTDSQSASTIYLYTGRVPITHWVINAVVYDDDADLPAEQVRHYLMILWMIACVLAMLLILIIGGLRVWSLGALSIVLTIIITICLVGLLYIVTITPIVRSSEVTIVSEQARASKFLENRDFAARRIHEALYLKIPLGLSITSLSFPTSSSIALTGYIWQKYPLNIDPNLVKPPFFSQAIEDIGYQKLYETKTRGYILVGWAFNATLMQYFDYKQYPFDTVVVQFYMENPDYSKEILFVPAFGDYRLTDPKSLPGIDIDFKLSGYSFEESYFGFKMLYDKVTYGLESYEHLPEDVILTYNVTLKRSLLYDFIVFLLPMFIIFFSLYGILTIEETEKLRGLEAIAAYTGLIFVVTLLHRSLRELHTTNEILYIEYLFFMMYVTFALLVIYSLLKRRYEVVRKMVYLFRIFFWPLQLGASLLITLGVFYM